MYPNKTMLLKEKMPFDEEKLLEMCEQCGIKQFYISLIELANVWFENGEHSELTLFLEKFIFDGGVFGNTTNNTKIKSAHQNGRIKNFLENGGAGIVGFCKLEKENPFNLGYAISFAIPLSDAGIDCIDTEPTHTYFHHYRTVNALIDNLALRTGLILADNGYRYGQWSLSGTGSFLV